MGILNRLLIVCLLAASLPAQRSPFFATVTGPDGKPLSNAVVTCVSSRNVLNPWPTDAVETRTDERGRARCNLLTGRIYVAWGIAAAADSDKHWVTAVARLVASGRVVTMPAVESHGERTVVLAGLDAWRKVGALSVRWYPDRTVDLSIDLGMPDQESVTIPASPWTHGVLAVRDALGVMACAHLPAGAVEQVELRQPKAATVEVVDEKGKPVANAKLTIPITGLGGSKMLMGSHLRHMPHLRPLGSTDASGMLSFFTPELLNHVEPWGTHHDILVLFADGQGMQQAAAATEQTADKLIIRTKAIEPLDVVIKGSGAADATLVGMGSFTATPAPSSHTFGPRPARTSLKSKAHWRVHGIGPSVVPLIRMTRKRPTAVLSNRINAPKSPVVIDLDSRTTATIQVTQKDVGPAACVLLVGRPNAQNPMQWHAMLATDSSGHADLLMEDGSYFVYAISGTSHGLAIVDAAESQMVAIELVPLETMSVRVYDADGIPIAGARARGDSTTMRGNVNGADLESQWIRLSTMMIWHFVEPCRSDQVGRMQIPVFLKEKCGARAKVWIAGAESEAFRLRPGTELDVVIQ